MVTEANERITIPVAGMTCASCVGNVEGSLRKVPGRDAGAVRACELVRRSVGMAIDPVCNMVVDEREPAAIATVAGRAYYFCALACKQAFLELGLGDGAEAQPAQLVDGQGKPVVSQSIPSGVVAILFTDVQASTELMGEIGEELGHAIMRTELDRQQEAVESQGGYAVKRLGDGMMAAFGAPHSALRCAVAVQSDDARDAKVRVRVGLHTGEVVVDGGDYFGKTVIIAARITARAQGGEILLSEASQPFLDPPEGWRFGPTRRARLKGFPGWQRIVSVERFDSDGSGEEVSP